MVCERYNALMYGTFFLYYKIHSHIYQTLITAQKSIQKIKKARLMNIELEFMDIRLKCEVGIKIIFCVIILDF